MKNHIVEIQYYQSPAGELILGAYSDKLCLCDWTLNAERREMIDRRIRKELQATYKVVNSTVIARAVAQLNEYFGHKRTEFDLPLLFVGTDFQKTVWNELLNIPYGEAETYAGLAKHIGNPKAVRAVAAANGANAISIFVPCHRVIGSNRQLTGYAGGLPAKKMLLDLEVAR